MHDRSKVFAWNIFQIINVDSERPIQVSYRQVRAKFSSVKKINGSIMINNADDSSVKCL